MSKTFTIKETNGTPDITQPGLYFDYPCNTFYIVGPNSLYETWCPANMTELWDSMAHDNAVPVPGEVINIDEVRPEIRGLCADDLKEMIAMSHEAAAVELVKNR